MADEQTPEDDAQPTPAEYVNPSGKRPSRQKMWMRGQELLTRPFVNRGTAFTMEDRKRLGLTGRLPVAVETLDQQAARCYAQLHGFDRDLDRYIYLDQLHNRNEVLYYKVLSDHLTELLPVVCDPTVGEAIKQWSRDYRRSRAVYLSIDHIDDVRA